MMITVYYDGFGLLIDSDVAESLNLQDGYRIKTEVEFWKILKRNAGAIISICTAKLIFEK